MIAEVQNLMQLAVTNVTAAQTDLKKWNLKIDNTLKQLRSTEMLYASVLMQRVLLGLVLVAAIVYFIRSISSDVTLLRSLAFSRISYLYSTSASDSKAFAQYFELMSGPEGATETKLQKIKKDSTRVGKVLDKVVERIDSAVAKHTG